MYACNTTAVWVNATTFICFISIQVFATTYACITQTIFTRMSLRMMDILIVTSLITLFHDCYSCIYIVVKLQLLFWISQWNLIKVIYSQHVDCKVCVCVTVLMSFWIDKPKQNEAIPTRICCWSKTSWNSLIIFLIVYIFPILPIYIVNSNKQNIGKRWLHTTPGSKQMLLNGTRITCNNVIIITNVFGVLAKSIFD